MNLFISSLFSVFSAFGAEPCFVVCPAGCNIVQGATYAESKYIYQTVRAWDLVAPALGDFPSTAAELEKLGDLQANGTCPIAGAGGIGRCSSNFINSRFFTGYDIGVDGSNARVIIRVKMKSIKRFAD